MGLTKKPSSVRSLVIRVIAYSFLTSGIITGIAAWYWREERPNLPRTPEVYIRELANMAFILFWLTLTLMGGAFWFYRGLRNQDTPPSKPKQEWDEQPRGGSRY
jgi:hypothetical protein